MVVNGGELEPLRPRVSREGSESVSNRTSNRNSELSEQAFKPYKLSNFSKELSHLRLKMHE